MKDHIKYLQRYEWKEEEAQATILVIDHYRTTYVETLNAYEKNLYTVVLYGFDENNYAHEWVRTDEINTTLAWVLETYAGDKNYFNAKYEKFQEIGGRIEHIYDALCEKGISHLSDREIASILEDLAQYSKEQYGYSIITECLDLLEKEEYASYFSNADQRDQEALITLFSTPEELLYLDEERLSMLKIARNVLQERNGATLLADGKLSQKSKEALREHTAKYFWIQNNFCKGTVLEKVYFLEELQNIVKDSDQASVEGESQKLENKKQDLERLRRAKESQYSLRAEAIEFYEVVRFFALFQDKRKVLVNKQVHCMELVLQEVSARRNVKRANFDRYTVAEIVELLTNDLRVSDDEFEERSRYITFSYIENDTIKTDRLSGSEAQRILDHFKEEQRKHIREDNSFSGFVASQGNLGEVFTGKVRIVFDPSDHTFEEGEILVTGMTRPEFMPLMKKAKAIITNEGGITTHAAIISREMNKPCIIGTKIATELLNDGDSVEVDIEKGLVRLIK